VESQTHKDIEHIFVDAYSTDGTLDLIHAYMEKNSDKYPIKLVQGPPKGISNAMNMGIQNAEGDLVHFVHSDDYYLNPNSLEKVVSYFKDKPETSWLIGNVVLEVAGEIIVLPYNEILRTQFIPLVSTFNWVPHENTFVRKGIFERHGLFKEDLKNNMDYEYWIRIMDSEKPVFVNESFTVFTIHSNSTTCNPKNWINIVREYFKIWKDAKCIPLIGKVEQHGFLKKVKEIKEVVSENIEKILYK
jgi:glycosyltransferase involved in cell wall biosynthesis